MNSAAIQRCDREIAEIERELGLHAAEDAEPMDAGEMEGALLGLHDWRAEREMLMRGETREGA